MKSKYLVLPVVVALAGFSLQGQAGTILNSADRFAVWGGSTVANTGTPILNGDLGIYPGTAFTGFAPGIVNGVSCAGGPVAQQAEIDLLSAYNFLRGKAMDPNLTGQDLGGHTLGTAVSAAVLLNEAQAGNVYWQAGSSAMLGGGTSFDGNILASQSITLNAGTSLSGRTLALNGVVALDNHVIPVPATVPKSGDLWLLAICVVGFSACKWLSM